MGIMRLVISLAALAFSTSLLAGTIYTWVDDAGVVHYNPQM